MVHGAHHQVTVGMPVVCLTLDWGADMAPMVHAQWFLQRVGSRVLRWNGGYKVGFSDCWCEYNTKLVKKNATGKGRGPKIFFVTSLRCCEELTGSALATLSLLKKNTSQFPEFHAPNP